MSVFLLIFLLSISAASAEIVEDNNLSDMDLDNQIEVYDNINNDSEDMVLKDNPDGDMVLKDNPDEDGSPYDSDLLYLNSDDSVQSNLGDMGNGKEDLSSNSVSKLCAGNENEDNAEILPKNTTLIILTPNDLKVYGQTDYSVKLLDENANPVSGAQVNFIIRNPKGQIEYDFAFTGADGIAFISLYPQTRGVYKIQASYDGDANYNPAQTVDSNIVFYEKTSFKTTKDYAYRSSDFILKLYSSSGTLLSKKKVIVSVNGKKYTKYTDSKGRISIRMPSNRRKVKLICTFSSSDYYESSQLSMQLPVYKRTVLKALVNSVLKGKCFKILLKGKDGKILKKQKVKIIVYGKTFWRTTNKKGIAYLKIRFKRNDYSVEFYYDNNGIYGPSSNSSVLNVIDPSGQFKRGLNQNTKRSVGQYFSGGGHARVSKGIRKKAKKITKNCSTKLDKAVAIFNYVKNNLDYEYYANTRYGAAKTLKLKKGNCCDHANLIVALSRAAKLPARYSHAQGCRFKKYGVQGHVWAQIYVGGRWYSADGTGYGNSLGHVSNWNTKSYHSFHSYRNLPF